MIQLKDDMPAAALHIGRASLKSRLYAKRGLLVSGADGKDIFEPLDEKKGLGELFIITKNYCISYCFQIIFGMCNMGANRVYYRVFEYIIERISRNNRPRQHYGVYK